MFNPFITGCLISVQVPKTTRWSRDAFLNVASGVGKRGGSYSEGSRRVKHDGETSGAEKRTAAKKTKNRAEDRFFFMNK